MDQTFLDLAVECTDSFLCISCGDGGAAAEGDMLKRSRASVWLQSRAVLSPALYMGATVRHGRAVTNVTCHDTLDTYAPDSPPNPRPRRSEPVFIHALARHTSGSRSTEKYERTLPIVLRALLVQLKPHQWQDNAIPNRELVIVII